MPLKSNQKCILNFSWRLFQRILLKVEHSNSGIMISNDEMGCYRFTKSKKKAFPSLLRIIILITITTIKSLFSDLTMQGMYSIWVHLGRKRKIKNEHSYANI